MTILDQLGVTLPAPGLMLVGCECSGRIRDAFRRRGWEAWSCDLKPSEVGGPHLQMSVEQAVEKKEWKLFIGNPPCTDLAVSGAWKFQEKGIKRIRSSLQFVKWMLDLPFPYLAVENPISVISSYLRRPDQIIQPYDFGEDASKATCLWLKNLPKLRPTQYVRPRLVKGLPRWANQTDSGNNKLSGDQDVDRARTFRGIARAMADQWTR